MSLRDLIRDDSPIEPICALLDALAPEQRLAETRSLDRGEQRRLYWIAKASPDLTLEDVVPADRAARAEVIHDGRNTLPLPRPWKLFQKRFCRPESGEGRLFGYNQSPFLSTVGPGFFVTIPTAGRPEWVERGAIVVDYFQVPDGPVAPGWPKVVPNDHGLQRFVYNRTRDFLRRVSKHVSIGAAFKGEKALDHYFILCRQA